MQLNWYKGYILLSSLRENREFQYKHSYTYLTMHTVKKKPVLLRITEACNFLV